MNSLLWITDAHLDHLPHTLQEAWFVKLATSSADMLLLGGDTANARIFSRMLGRIQEVFPGKVALVAGNHDYYHSSISDLRSELTCLHRGGVIVFEPRCQVEPLKLTEGVYLCGSGGWGDASAGCADARRMELNDEYLISEFKTGHLNDRLRKLGQESAKHLEIQLAAVPENASSVIVLTHVPPWPEAAWHEGANSDATALARFCWQAGGEVISKAAERMSLTRFIILCGHTHSAGIWENGNIICHTAGSAYERIDHSGIVTLGNKVFVSM